MACSSGGGGVLTRRHGCRCVPDIGVSVEECLVAVGEVVGFNKIKSASRMNKALVIFLTDVDLVNKLVEEGFSVQGSFIEVSPLVTPVTKVILSNVPPFLKNELLERELSRYGKLMSPIKTIPLGCKNPSVKHVLSFRRQAFILQHDPNLVIEVAWNFNVEGTNCVVFASSDTMRCFKCGAQGHQRKQCPRNRDAEQDKGAPGGEEARGDRGEREDEQPPEPAKPESAEPADPEAAVPEAAVPEAAASAVPEAAASAVPEAVSTPQHKRHSQAQTASGQETGQSQEFEMVAKKKKKKKNIQSEKGEPKRDPGLVFVGSGEKTQPPGVIVAESGGDPQPMPDEELTSSPEAVPPCPEEEGTSTELPQSDYETGSKTGGGTEAEAVAVESGEAAEEDGADGEEDEGMYETDDGGLSDSSLISDVPDSQPVRKKLYTLQHINNFLDSTKVVLCSPPLELSHGYLVAVQRKQYEAGEVIYYLCRKGFLLDGSNRVVCQSNGTWSPTPFCRARCAIPAQRSRVLYNGQKLWPYEVQGGQVQHGEGVSFYCRDEARRCSYTIQSECFDGTLPLPPCYDEPTWLQYKLFTNRVVSEIKHCDEGNQ